MLLQDRQRLPPSYSAEGHGMAPPPQQCAPSTVRCSEPEGPELRYIG